MLTALAALLDIQTVSRPYPDRPPSTLERIHIDAVIRNQDENGGGVS